MANASFGDAARDNLRALVATVDREIAQLAPAGDGKPAIAELHASWGALVAMLALGPAPETRECPVCHGSGMRAASRCGHCWAKLDPITSEAPRPPASAVTTTTTTAAAQPAAAATTTDAPRTDA